MTSEERPRLGEWTCLDVVSFGTGMRYPFFYPTPYNKTKHVLNLVNMELFNIFDMGMKRHFPQKIIGISKNGDHLKLLWLWFNFRCIFFQHQKATFSHRFFVFFCSGTTRRSGRGIARIRRADLQTVGRLGVGAFGLVTLEADRRTGRTYARKPRCIRTALNGKKWKPKSRGTWWNNLFNFVTLFFWKYNHWSIDN